MNTTSWGPSAWIFIHCVLANYTPEKKKEYIAYFTGLKDILPCSYCRISYTYFLQLLPIENYLDTRLHAMYWGYLLHNLVNTKLEKTSPSFIDVLKQYDKYRARPNH